MKKNFIILLIGLLPFMSLAQTTIGSSVNPSIGDVYSFTLLKDTSIMRDPGPSGNGVAWSFSNFSDSSMYDFTYSDTTGKPRNASVYPRSNMAFKEAGSSASGLYGFANQNSSAYSICADLFYILNSYYCVPYNGNLDLFRYPMNFGNSFQDADTGYWTVSVPGQGSTDMKRTISSVTTYDGFGNLTINGASKTNVSRIHILQTIIDTINEQLSPPVYVNQVNSVKDIYMWFDNVNKKPVMIMEKDSSRSIGMFQTSTVTRKVLIDDIFLGVKKDQTSNSISIYPNPASNQLLLHRGSDSKEEVRIFDSNGKLVYQSVISGTKNMIDISSLAKGIYFIETGEMNSGKTIRFIKD